MPFTSTLPPSPLSKSGIAAWLGDLRTAEEVLQCWPFGVCFRACTFLADMGAKSLSESGSSNTQHFQMPTYSTYLKIKEEFPQITCCRAPPCSLPSPSWPSSATSSLTSWDGDPDCEGSRVRVEMDPGCSSLTRDCGRVTKLPSVAGLHGHKTRRWAAGCKCKRLEMDPGCCSLSEDSRHVIGPLAEAGLHRHNTRGWAAGCGYNRLEMHPSCSSV
eukprot:834167-Pelagomonas_calceolata.AAC.3